MGNLRTEGATGVVTTYEHNQGYGFVSTLDVETDETTDVFFHISELTENTVEKGWRFQFDVYSSQKGFRAENIEVLRKEPIDSNEDESAKERFFRARRTEHDDGKRSMRVEQLEGNKDNEADEEDDQSTSPFDDDLSGSKNDLL